MSTGSCTVPGSGVVIGIIGSVVGIAIGSVGIAFAGGVFCAGVCPPAVLGVLGVAGMLGVPGAEAFMPEPLEGVLGVLPGACA
jgi:hypothetical protein